MTNRTITRVVWVFLLCWSRVGHAGEPPFHQQIDQLLAADWKTDNISPADTCDDAEFMRRVYIDLTGTIPRSVDAREFFADTSPGKRQRLVDRLLGSPEFARHFSRVLDCMLMERRPDKHVPSAEWLTYLREALAENRPWDQLVREILSADGADPKSRPAAKFLLDREAEPALLTKDVSRLFLGMNYQCAQCHDHPLVGDYEQRYYYGLYAFFNRSYLFTDKKNKNVVSLAEKADGEVKFKSVFEKQSPEQTTGPRLFDEKPLDEPKFEKGKEYTVAPSDGVRPVPAFSRRAQLAGHLATAQLTPFRRNIVNRLWAHMMGRGLVHPLDLDHSDNPPAHPALLDLLALEFSRPHALPAAESAGSAPQRFNIQWLLRELALSQTYQRSSRLTTGLVEPPPQTCAIATLKPLSPEQLGWCLVQATGVADTHRAALGDKLTEPALHDRLAPGVASIIATFAGPAAEPDGKFQATLDQALFLSNGGTLRSWLAPSAGNLADRLAKLQGPAEFAEELFLCILTRQPTTEEIADITQYLEPRSSDRAAAIQELIWALLTSAEFRFNH